MCVKITEKHSYVLSIPDEFGFTHEITISPGYIKPLLAILTTIVNKNPEWVSDSTYNRTITSEKSKV